MAISAPQTSAIALPAGRWKSLGYSLVIAAGLIAALAFINRGYLFHTFLYEHGDEACNSLSVLRAARFHEIYGAFSRWDLHHPGPCLFYLFAWAELLFYQTLKLVPTPANAQVLASMILSASFFAGALCVAARWIRSRYFLPLALLFAALHYTAVDPRMCLMSPWPPYTMPMIFLALMVAAASVGAGQGDDLPLLVLAGGFAVHSNLAQPLFVVPLFALGYLGLVAWCWRAARAARRELEDGLASAADIPRAKDLPYGRALSARPWRRFPLAHAFGAFLLFAFALPLLVDLCKGSGSNIAKIVHDLPGDPTKYHPWLACALYVLRFSVYRPSIAGSEYFFSGHARRADLFHFCFTHPEMMILWSLALVSPLLALAARPLFKPRPITAPAPTPDTEPESQTPVGETKKTSATDGASAVQPLDPATRPRGRWRFIGWLFICWILGIGMALYRARILQVEMAYYHLWFSYSIWFVLALIGAAASSDLLETFALRSRKPWRWPVAVALLSLAGIAILFLKQEARFHDLDYTDPASLGMSRVVQEALADQASGSRTKLLTFPANGSGAASGVAAILAREGYQVRVAPEWLNSFGPEYAPPDLLDGLPFNADGSAPFDIWRIVPAASDPAAAREWPLPDGYALKITHPNNDPTSGAEITFSGEHPNYDDFLVAGWSARVVNVPFTWSDGKLGLLCFHPLPVPENEAVEVVFDGFPRLLEGVRDYQRINVAMNADKLGSFHLATATPNPLPSVLIPAAVWNRQPLAMMSLEFLDNFSPGQTDPNGDPRHFAFATRRITFRTVEAAAARP